MERTIAQRELRNDIAEIMRALETGETFIITRNGVPVGRLTPIAPNVRDDQEIKGSIRASSADLSQLARGFGRIRRIMPDAACLTVTAQLRALYDRR